MKDALLPKMKSINEENVKGNRTYILNLNADILSSKCREAGIIIAEKKRIKKAAIYC